MNWHSASLSEIEQKFGTNFKTGLSQKDATDRLRSEGKNTLPESRRETVFQIFIRQFKSSLIFVLLFSAGVLFFLGDLTDGLIVLFVLFFNAIIGTVQEGRAQNTLHALKKFTTTDATVLRDGRETIIPDFEVARGDSILLQEGERVPADARLIEANGLRVDESAFTGESLPIEKDENAIVFSDAPVAEQKNMVLKGTHIVAGNGSAVVVATGRYSYIGKISVAIQEIKTEIPLAKDIRLLSRDVLYAVACIGGSIFLIGFLKGHAVAEMFKTVVSLAVSIIPEGLPIVLTLVLASGAWRMAKKNALIKKLQAVEALGQATIIAVDKTGTITRNELVVRRVFVGGKLFAVDGIGYNPHGDVRICDPQLKEGSVIDPLNHPELIFAGKIATLSARAHVSYLEKEGIWKVSGDPTEAALSIFGEKIGFRKDLLEAELKPMSELPFSHKNRYHASLYETADAGLVIVVGAPEIILEKANEFFLPAREGGGFAGTAHSLTHEKFREFERVFDGLSREGMRVVAFGFLTVPKGQEFFEVRKLTFGGLYAMEDTLRPEVRSAVADANAAGVRVVMITGDHAITAMAVARDAGIYADGDAILTGADIDSLDEREFERRLPMVSVFARVTPEHKLKIIRAYKRNGETVAMTGDGVNDAPSLIAADLGVAMGKIGTEVAKEASDVVLLDDNFQSIVSAIEEGRHIFRTIKKVILYLFSTSVGEALAIMGALFMGYPLPILPAQILWLNLITDGFLDVALAMEPKSDELLLQKFRARDRKLLDSLMLQRIIVMSIPMMIGSLFLFQRLYENDLQKALTVSLTTLAIFQWLNALNCRSDKKSIFSMNPFSNPYLIAALCTVFLLQLFAVYNPFMQSILKTVPLTGAEWLVAFFVACSVVVAEEIRKLVYRRFKWYQ
ncbi:MAG: HAD-IC family P-type ATPase [Patescibacteria group bacterium]